MRVTKLIVYVLIGGVVGSVSGTAIAAAFGADQAVADGGGIGLIAGIILAMFIPRGRRRHTA